MGAPTTPIPGDPGYALGERETLMGFLRYFRVVLVRKAEGLTDAQLRAATCPPSDLTLLGLVRHMAEVERIWARWLFSGQVNEPHFYGDAHPSGDLDGDFHAPASATLDDALEVFWSEVEAADRIYDAAPLDQIEVGAGDDRPGERSLRWILVHLIEEYARHCGHADLLREAIDGTTGD